MGTTLSSNRKCGYRVLAVQAHSPASKAGLVSFFDIILSVNDVYLGSESLESFLNIVKVRRNYFSLICILGLILCEDSHSLLLLCFVERQLIVHV